MSSIEEVWCYNKGCGTKFNPNENTEESCTYHPGPPYFHDAYKIWKCCDKKSTDFSTWLGIKGCTKGKHSNKKTTVDSSDKASSKEINPVDPETVIVWSGLNKPTDRSDCKNREFVTLPLELGQNAQKALDEHIKSLDLVDKFHENEVSAAIGQAACQNNSCKAIFDGSKEMEDASCLYHTGTAIFHEGIKYWSCCKRKTTDFASFLDQIGCTQGHHCWEKSILRQEKLREDWFQALGYVHINIYCKGALPAQSSFLTDGLNLQIKVVHGYGEKKSLLEYSLFGEILPEKSHIRINERKVEVILKQSRAENWPRLVYDSPNPNVTNSDS